MLLEQGIVTQDFFSQVEESSKLIKKEVIQNLRESSLEPISDINSLFEDVYKEVPKNLKNQFDQLKDNMQQYPEYYPDKYYFRK